MYSGRSFVGLLALGMASCIPPGMMTQVHFTPAGGELVGTPRVWKCRMEFFRSKTPERPYDELGSLFAMGSKEPKELQEELSQKACAVGADAILITRDYAMELVQTPGFVTGGTVVGGTVVGGTMVGGMVVGGTVVGGTVVGGSVVGGTVPVWTVTGTAIRYRKEAGAATSPASGACQFAFSVGKWSLCQIGTSSIYVWWMGNGRGVAARFPSNGKGEWFLRREEKTVQVEGKRCRGENNPTCNSIFQTPVSGESWELPETAESTSVKEETRFDLGETHFVLSETQIQVDLPDQRMVRFPADRAVPKTGTLGMSEEL